MNNIKIMTTRLCAMITVLLFAASIAPAVTVFASTLNGVLAADTYDILPDGTAWLPNWGIGGNDDLLTGVSVEGGMLRLSNEDTAEGVKINTWSVHDDGIRKATPTLRYLEVLIEFNVRKSSYATTYFEQIATNGNPLYRISFEDDGVVRVHNCRTTANTPNGNYTSQAGSYNLGEFFNIKIKTLPDTARFSVYVNDVPIVESATHMSPTVVTTRRFRFGIDERGDDETKIVSFELADFFIRDIQKSAILDDAGAVSAAAELLTYGRLLSSNTGKQNVVTELSLIDGLAVTNPLPVSGSVVEDVEIEWQSSNEDVIDPVTGYVTRPTDGEPDADVTLAATIRKGTEETQKTFDFTVLRIANAAYDVASAISIVGSVGKETSKINLPATDPSGNYDAVITWESDMPDVIAPDGTVMSTREEAIVTLTANVSVEGFPDIVKRFKVHVIPDTGEENILIGCDASTNGLVVYNLPSNAIDGDIATVWKSSIETGSTLTITLDKAARVEKAVLRELSAGVKNFHIYVLSNSIWQPVYVGNRSETGSEIINFNPVNCTGIRLFIAEANGEVSLAEFEAFGSTNIGQEAKSDAEALTLGDTNDVTDDIILPLTGERGSEISWTSSNTAVIKIEGGVAKVTRPQASTSAKIAVTLTAKVTKDGYTETKQFTIRVVPVVITSPPGQGGSSTGKTSPDSTPVTSPALPINTNPIPGNDLNEKQTDLPFADVQSDGWEYPYIQKLYSKKMITGVSDNAFEPSRSITREEFVTIVVKVLNLTSKSTALLFDDVPAGEWYAPYIAAAYENDIITGNSDTVFGVGSNVTRQEMAAIIYRAARLAGIELNTEDKIISFTDNDEISDWAKEAVDILHSTGIIDGINGAFRPAETATRAQAAKLACALLKDKN